MIDGQSTNDTPVERLLRSDRFSIGLAFPIESYSGAVARMESDEQLRIARRAEDLGFAALWVRDVPLLDPQFGDAGHVFDPWSWLGAVAATTNRIVLATGSVILPLRHPIDVAKAAASVDRIAGGGRMMLGAASGDRPVEYPAYGVDPAERGERFREAVLWLRRLWEEDFPRIDGTFGTLAGGDMQPKPRRSIPLIVTGGSRQPLEWTARHSDAWLTYPRPGPLQARVAHDWGAACMAAGKGRKPLLQSLYVDLSEKPDEAATPIHLGYRLGRDALCQHLRALMQIGVNHVFLNLKYGRRPADAVVEEIGSEVLPELEHLRCGSQFRSTKEDEAECPVT